MKNIVEQKGKSIEPGFDTLPIAVEIKKDIVLLRDKLAAYTGIHVTIVDITDGTITAIVEQKELKNNYILNQTEIVSRARAVFDPLAGKFKIHFRALSFNPSFSDVNADWINNCMNEFKLSRNDVLKQMGLDKSTLSVLLTGAKNLTRFQRAAFYYYFKTYELNRDFREV